MHRISARALVLLCLSSGVLAADISIVFAPKSSGVTTRYMGVNSMKSIATVKALNLNSVRQFINVPGYGKTGKSPADVKAAGTNKTAVEQCINTNQLSSFRTNAKNLNDAGLHILFTFNKKIHESMPSENQAWLDGFGVIYEVNVLHNLDVHTFEIENEPNLHKVAPAAYGKYLKAVYEGMTYCYQTFLPGTEHIICGGGLAWPDFPYWGEVVKQAPTQWDGIAWHHYYHIDTMITQARRMRQVAGSGKKLWLCEWGTFDFFTFTGGNKWTNVNIRDDYVAKFSKFILVLSRSEVAVEGWSYYKHAPSSSGAWDGLLTLDGQETPMCHALKLMGHSIMGAKPMYEPPTSSGDVTALAALGANNTLEVVAVNTANAGRTVDIDVSAIFTRQPTGIESWVHGPGKNYQKTTSPSMSAGKIAATLGNYQIARYALSGGTIGAPTTVSTSLTSAPAAHRIILKPDHISVQSSDASPVTATLYNTKGQILFNGSARLLHIPTSANQVSILKTTHQGQTRVQTIGFSQ